MADEKFNTEEDWLIYAVYDDPETKEPLIIYSHGLERCGLRNLCMDCPEYGLARHCTNLLNIIIRQMMKGETYSCDYSHIIDNSDNPEEVWYIFDIEEDRRDNGDGEEDFYVIKCDFDKPFYHPYNQRIYAFNKTDCKWEIIL